MPSSLAYSPAERSDRKIVGSFAFASVDEGASPPSDSIFAGRTGSIPLSIDSYYEDAFLRSAG